MLRKAFAAQAATMQNVRSARDIRQVIGMCSGRPLLYTMGASGCVSNRLECNLQQYRSADHGLMHVLKKAFAIQNGCPGCLQSHLECNLQQPRIADQQ